MREMSIHKCECGSFDISLIRVEKRGEFRGPELVETGIHKCNKCGREILSQATAVNRLEYFTSSL